jgi:hypothetical protein
VKPLTPGIALALLAQERRLGIKAAAERAAREPSPRDSGWRDPEYGDLLRPRTKSRLKRSIR